MVSQVAQSTGPRVPRAKKVSLTPLELQQLKKGPKANVVIGPDGNHFVGLEGASVGVLTHFSPLAKKKLIDERATTLRIPDGSKQPLTWIYKYMRSGEAGAEGEKTLESLDVDNLVLLYKHTALLEYQHLMGRIVLLLQGKYSKSLPTVAHFRTFAAFAPSMFDYAIGVLAHEMANPWACDYNAYYELENSDQGFADALDSAIQKLVQHRVKIGTEYYERMQQKATQGSREDSVNGLAQDAAQTKTKNRHAQKPKNGTTAAAGTEVTAKSRRAAKPKEPFTCYNCGEDGHMSRNCAAPKKEKAPRAVLVCYNCNAEGHLSRDCTKEKKQARPHPVCYNCHEVGHVVHDCYIKVSSNGESLATCDREVKKGEKTRTGLVI